MINKTLISIAVGSVIAVVPIASLHAALPAKAQLVLDPGGSEVTSCVLGTIDPVSGNCSFGGATNTGLNITAQAGSFFQMGGGTTNLTNNNGIILGSIQSASGNHAGLPDGTETGFNIDQPWAFSSNTGVHQTTSAITEVSPGVLDMAGWNVAWGGVNSIPMGGCFLVAGGCDTSDPKDGIDELSNTGLASIVVTGSSYVLDYFANVPVGDASGFGGAGYTLRLEGAVVDLNINPVVSDGVLEVGLSGTNTIDVSTLYSDAVDATGTNDAIDCSVMTITPGTVTPTQVGTSCVISYSDPGGVDGTDSFTFTVGDASGGTSNIATVNVTVNDAPVAANGNLVVDLNSGNTIDLKTLVTDSSTIDWTTLDYSTYAGTATIIDDGNGVATYTDNGGAPEANDPFDYTVDDTDGATSNVGTISVKVNNPPSASGTSASLSPSTTVGIDLSGLVSDTDGTIDCTSFATTYTGTAIIDFTANDCTGTYTDIGGVDTTDAFNYTFNDNDGTTSNSATVNVNIVTGNLPPNAGGTTVTAQKDEAVDVDITTLASDPDGDNLDLTSISISSVINGTITNINTTTGVVTFTPIGGFTGTASFDYTIADDNAAPATSTPAATVTVNVNAPPVANAGNLVVPVSGNNTIDLKTLVSDPDVSGINWATLDHSTYAGTATITDNGNGVVTYADNGGVSTSDSFDFTVQDNDGGTSNSATISVVVNVAPVATDQSILIVPSATVVIALDVTDSDGTLDCTSVAIIGYAGTATLDTTANDCTVSYTDTGAVDAVDSFNYTVNDNDGTSSNSATVTVTVNGSPSAADTSVNVNRNSSIAVDVVALLVTDADAIDKTTVNASQGGNGSTAVDPVTGVVTYKPATGFTGSDSFTYSVSDSVGSVSNTATVSITVNNNLPVAANDNGAVDVTLVSNISLDVTANDSDVDGNIERTTVAVTSETGGTTSVDAVTGVVTFTPTVGVFGNGGFTYTIADNDGGLSNVAIVTINVPDPSVAAGLPVDALLTFNLATNTVAPVDGDGSWFSMSGSFIALESFNGLQVGVEQPATGSHSGAPDGTESKNIDEPWLFFSNTGLHQTVSAATILSDDGAGNVTLDLSGWSVTWNGIPNIAMNAGAHSGGTDGIAIMTCANACALGDTYILNYYATVPDDGATNFGNIQYTLHLEGTITQGVIPATAPVATGDAASVATSGSVVIDLSNNVFDKSGNPHTDIDFSTLSITHTAAGNNTVVDNGNGIVTYTDIDGVDATDSFTFKVSDNNGESSNSATVTINVSSGNLPPSASSFSVQVALDTATDIDVKATDRDGTIDAATVSASQSINGNGTTGVDPVTGVVTYTPNVGFVGSDSFTYSVKDNADAGSNLATVNIFVNATPLAVDDAAVVDRNSSVDINVSFNDTDADGSIDSTTVYIVSNVINGFTVIDPVTGVVTYTPDVDYLGADSFTYEVNDDAGTTTNIATVTITVSNALPVAVDEAVNIDTATTLSVDADVTANDSDADGAIDKTTVAIVAAATNGGTSIDPVTGVISYTPDSGFVGSDSFTYTVNDDDGGTSNEALVVVSISNSLGAVLPADAFLTIVPATITSETIFNTPAVGEGSWFYMEVKPGFLTHVSLQGFNQLQLGTSQLASDDAPDIDSAWTFFGNLGVHQTTSVVTILSDNGLGNVTLDLSGWDVSWNKIPSIPLNARANEAGFVDGVAIMTCAADCSVGDTYILEYSATVPDGDVSGFGNVKYFLHLEGTILLDAPSIGGGDENAPSDVDESDAKNEDGSVVTVVPGDTAASAGNTSGIHLTPEDIGLKDPLLNNNDGEQCIGGCIDFVATGITGTYADFVFKLNDVIPEGAAYRKLKNGVWQSFDESQGDLIGSAAAINGMCQGPDGVFEIGLRAGHMCLYMRIFDNGPNDADIIVGSITDPSGILLSGSPNTPAGSTSGCSITGRPVSLFERADWLLIAAFVVLLAVRRRKKTIFVNY